MDIALTGGAIALVIVLYCLAEILKATLLKDESKRALLPIICGLLGALIAVVIYSFSPEVLGCKDYLNAVVVGAISGFAATGANQVYKQLKKNMSEATSDE